MTTITNAQIRLLRDEATEAGDYRQVDLCELALQGDRHARAECQRVIENASAQEDGE